MWVTWPTPCGMKANDVGQQHVKFERCSSYGSRDISVYIKYAVLHKITEKLLIRSKIPTYVTQYGICHVTSFQPITAFCACVVHYGSSVGISSMSGTCTRQMVIFAAIFSVQNRWNSTFFCIFLVYPRSRDQVTWVTWPTPCGMKANDVGQQHVKFERCSSYGSRDISVYIKYAVLHKITEKLLIRSKIPTYVTQYGICHVTSFQPITAFCACVVHYGSSVGISSMSGTCTGQMVIFAAICSVQNRWNLTFFCIFLVYPHVTWPSHVSHVTYPMWDESQWCWPTACQIWKM